MDDDDAMGSRTPSGIGRRGEDAIAAIATARGAEIVGRNLRSGHAEVDLMILSRGVTWAIEVKSAQADSMAADTLHQRLDPRQLGRVRRAAETIARLRGLPTPVRLLAALVTFPSHGDPAVDWVEDLDDARYSGK